MFNLSPEQANAVEIILGTIAGAIISGVIGLLSSRHSLLARVKEDHYRQHRDNFEVIKGALIDLENRLYPYRNAEAAEGSFANRFFNLDGEFWGNYSILNYLQKIPDSQGNINYRRPDEICFDDMEVHFSELYRKIKKIQEESREYGLKHYKNLTEVVRSIFFEIDLQHPMIFDERSKLVPFIGNKFEDLYATAILNLALGLDPKIWHKKYELMKLQKQFLQIQPVLDMVESKNKSQIDAIKKFENETLPSINEAVSELDQLIHRRELKKRCEYMEF